MNKSYLLGLLVISSCAHAEFLNELTYQYNQAGNQLQLKQVAIATDWKYPQTVKPVGQGWQQYLIKLNSTNNVTQAFCDYRIRQAYVDGQVSSTHYHLHNSDCQTAMAYGCVVACAPVDVTVSGTSTLFHDINMIVDGND